VLERGVEMQVSTDRGQMWKIEAQSWHSPEFGIFAEEKWYKGIVV
jgi:hypothetical protein